MLLKFCVVVTLGQQLSLEIANTSVIGTTRGGKIYTDISLSSGGVDKTIQDKLRAGGWYHVSATQPYQ